MHSESASASVDHCQVLLFGKSSIFSRDAPKLQGNLRPLIDYFHKFLSTAGPFNETSQKNIFSRVGVDTALGLGLRLERREEGGEGEGGKLEEE